MKDISKNKKRVSWSKINKGYKIKDTSNMKGRIPWSKLNKGYKIKDTSKMGKDPNSRNGFQKGHQINKGRKIKDTSKYKGAKRGEKHWNWKDGRSRSDLKSLEYREKLAGRKKPEQCEVCGAFEKDFKYGLCFDHDHITGAFRGWICGRCNIALGMVKDKIEILSLLIEYLELHKKKND